MKKIICHNCQREIDLKLRYVNLRTLEGKKEIESHFYHLNCGKDYFNERAKRYAESIIKQSVPKVKEMVRGMLTSQ